MRLMLRLLMLSSRRRKPEPQFPIATHYDRPPQMEALMTLRVVDYAGYTDAAGATYNQEPAIESISMTQVVIASNPV